MLVVADSSALIALAACEGLELLLQVFDDLKVPEAVYAETVSPEKPYSEILGKFLSDKVVKVDTSRRWTRSWGNRGNGAL